MLFFEFGDHWRQIDPFDRDHRLEPIGNIGDTVGELLVDEAELIDLRKLFYKGFEQLCINSCVELDGSVFDALIGFVDECFAASERDDRFDRQLKLFGNIAVDRLDFGVGQHHDRCALFEFCAA